MEEHLRDLTPNSSGFRIASLGHRKMNHYLCPASYAHMSRHEQNFSRSTITISLLPTLGGLVVWDQSKRRV
jgi:hypothetical protein